MMMVGWSQRIFQTEYWIIDCVHHISRWRRRRYLTTRLAVCAITVINVNCCRRSRVRVWWENILYYINLYGLKNNYVIICIMCRLVTMWSRWLFCFILRDGFISMFFPSSGFVLFSHSFLYNSVRFRQR